MAVICDICTKKPSNKRGLYILTFVSGDLGDLCLMLEPIKMRGGLADVFVPHYGVICTDCLRKLNVTTALQDCSDRLEALTRKRELPNVVKDL